MVRANDQAMVVWSQLSVRPFRRYQPGRYTANETHHGLSTASSRGDKHVLFANQSNHTGNRAGSPIIGFATSAPKAKLAAVIGADLIGDKAQ